MGATPSKVRFFQRAPQFDTQEEARAWAEEHGAIGGVFHRTPGVPVVGVIELPAPDEPEAA